MIKKKKGLAQAKAKNAAPKTPRRATGRAKPASDALQKPIKRTGAKIDADERDDEGPAGWLLPDLESAYARLAPQTAAAAEPVARVPSTGAKSAVAFTSALQPGKGEEVLGAPKSAAWLDVLAEFKQRKAARISRVALAAVRPGAPHPPGAPAIPGARNWAPLGPSVVLNGQTIGNEPIGGRVSGMAIAPGGLIVYAASANGGVFRSNDGGTTWQSLMDRFDLDPTQFATASLVCGAIAIDPADPDRVYVGTGEGDTDQIFRNRIVNALPAYRGIGPIRTDDGGDNWEVESAAAGSPTLAGESFFALAVDPGNRENVVGATTTGLYQRTVAAGGPAQWVQRRPKTHSSVVVAAAGGTTRFYAAEWGVGVFTSTDGVNWSAAGTGFPSSGVSRIALGVQRSNPNRAYAFVSKTNGSLHGVYRLDGVNASWKKIASVPNVLPVDEQGGSQGDYDLTIAVDPVNANLIYLGGSYAPMPTPQDPQWPWPGAIWRCPIQAAGAGFKVNHAKSIGTHAHADDHVLIHTPDDPNELWVGCDGGVFLNRDPRATGEFAGQNNGLACLCCNFIAQHPTDPSILYTGLQDNGTARTSGSPTWTHISGGDGGYCVVNWDKPEQVIAFANGTVYRSDTSGLPGPNGEDAWKLQWDFPWATMTLPIVTTPYHPEKPAEADILAIASGRQINVSEDFAGSWPNNLGFVLPADAGSAFALAFASPTRLYIGTTAGQVFRADRGASGWTTTRLDNAGAGPLGLNGLISDVAVDWSDATLSSIYLAFGGAGDRRHVWWFDGTKWEARNGDAAGNDLLDVEHNALIVDPAAPDNLYVGADIGVWHSPDRGATWQPLENGLPDAPVYDLQIHPTQRLLRAATHGRGVFEIPLE
jgi:hypothetical protein